jgi:hypothetical protein
MSDLLALDPTSMPTKADPSPAHRFSLSAMFGRLMESLVASHSRQFEGSEPLFYRYPPI